MRFTALVSTRILSGTRHSYLSVVSRIAVLGVTIGVATLVVVFSISTGFSDSFQQKVLALYPHLIVAPRSFHFVDYNDEVEKIRNIDGVVEVLPATYDELMLIHKDRRAEVYLKGLPLREKSLSDRLHKSRSEKTQSPFLKDPPLSVELKGDSVLVKGGVAGSNAQILVWKESGHATRAFTHESIWAKPPQGHDLITFASAQSLVIQCTTARRTQNFEIMSNGGFSQTREFLVGPVDCVGKPTSGHGDELHWQFSARGDQVRTLILNNEGVDLDIKEPNTPKDVYSSVRVYWPGKESFVVQEPEGLEHTINSAKGRWLKRKDLPLPILLLGSSIAERVKVEVGDEVQLMSPMRGLEDGGMGPVGMTPTLIKMRIGGILHTGFHEFDNRFVIANLPSVQRFFQKGDSVYWLEIRIDNISRTQSTATKIRAQLEGISMPDFLQGFVEANRRVKRLASGEISQFGDTPAGNGVEYLERVSELGSLLRSSAYDLVPESHYKIIDWRRINRALLSAILWQQVVLTVFFLIIIIVSASNVVGNQIMLIHEKTSNIAILRAMGASQRQVQRVFRIQGLVTAVIGTVIGGALGIGVCMILQSYPLGLNAEIYFIEELPVEPSFTAFAVVAGATLAGTWLATHLSAKKASELDPVAALHRID
jgi:ABC-type lipoprotein release transport system permease subunit